MRLAPVPRLRPERRRRRSRTSSRSSATARTAWSTASSSRPCRQASYSAAQLDAFARAGDRRSSDDGDGTITLVIPLSVAFGNPDLLERRRRSARCSQSLGAERAVPERRADRQLAAQRPVPGAEAGNARSVACCGAPVVNPDCFTGVVGSRRDRHRARPRPRHAALQRRCGGRTGWRRRASFTDDHRRVDRALPARSADRPARTRSTIRTSSTSSQLRDARRQRDPARRATRPDEDAVTGVRRTTLAARLKAIYGRRRQASTRSSAWSPSSTCAGTEFGELQLAIWKKQFEALRDGDRFFYATDPALASIDKVYGIDYRQTLAEVIKLNTGVQFQPNVFISAG